MQDARLGRLSSPSYSLCRRDHLHNSDWSEYRSKVDVYGNMDEARLLGYINVISSTDQLHKASRDKCH